MFVLHTKTLHSRTAIHRHSLGGVLTPRRGFEIRIECLLVVFKLKKTFLHRQNCKNNAIMSHKQQFRILQGSVETLFR